MKEEARGKNENKTLHSVSSRVGKQITLLCWHSSGSPVRRDLQACPEANIQEISNSEDF